MEALTRELLCEALKNDRPLPFQCGDRLRCHESGDVLGSLRSAALWRVSSVYFRDEQKEPVKSELGVSAVGVPFS